MRLFNVIGVVWKNVRDIWCRTICYCCHLLILQWYVRLRLLLFLRSHSVSLLFRESMCKLESAWAFFALVASVCFDMQPFMGWLVSGSSNVSKLRYIICLLALYLNLCQYPASCRVNARRSFSLSFKFQALTIFSLFPVLSCIIYQLHNSTNPFRALHARPSRPHVQEIVPQPSLWSGCALSWNRCG